MSRKIRNQNDFVIGSFYILIGAAAAVIAASRYELGTANRMGPGYFPLILGVILCLLGTTVLLRALSKNSERTALARWDLRSLLWMVGSLLLFSFALKPLGLVLSLAMLIIVSSLASHEFTWKGTLINAAVQIALNLGLFIYFLGLPFAIWPSFLTS
ncbi:tripartite tricarboxylate transporter TctB family protein [Ottowia thiooxydans]|uniref:tripartite tricarboxylate transporter TctB family protein n=1 Tax=Ottowia thiooxydans TaxID=219182 RepID=UPI0003FFE6E2|nr:tripartite tricarboxylate transporter TctB family protein [Ottowia thiooxydans]